LHFPAGLNVLSDIAEALDERHGDNRQQEPGHYQVPDSGRELSVAEFLLRLLLSRPPADTLAHRATIDPV
jgi:hypothetical protein